MYLEDKIICILPILLEESKTREAKNTSTNRDCRKYRKIANKIKKDNKDDNRKEIVLSSELMKQKSFVKDLLSDSNIQILDGKWLAKYLLFDCIKYIADKQKEKIEEQEISIMLNEHEDINIQTIIHIAQKVKMVNIITDNIGRFIKVEEYLQDNYGIILRVTNNKKAMLKSSIVINIDFNEEKINRYHFSKKAKVISLYKEIDIKKLEGNCIKDYKIEMNNKNIKEFKEYNLYKYFDKNLLYEGIIYRKDSYRNITNEIQKDNIKIKSLIKI